MYQQLTPNMYLVSSKEDFEQLVQFVFPPSTSIMADVLDRVKDKLPRPTEFPSIVTAHPDIGLQFIPALRLVGGLGTIHQLDMRREFDGLVRACKSCSPHHQPRILLNAIVIQERTNTVPVGVIAHVHRNNKTDLLDAISRLGEPKVKPKSLRIQFGDGQFHGSVEMDGEMMFVSTVRDITNLVASVTKRQDGLFDAEYTFNHYDFMHAIPELEGYRDLSKWEIAVMTAVESTMHYESKD
ncbi:hypothetical protein pEaSNUABM37_00212 [Erwinia phage pEa_SNUABM_37]|nr:hypothetical protein pEaSNUABM37_00212 [Erwinia phage pEa_SNUABM_37]QXO10682.1 hypothetical protein pEaSNUABM48_00212 [Erwinia phage pEa_SNUABM_48]